MKKKKAFALFLIILVVILTASLLALCASNSSNKYGLIPLNTSDWSNIINDNEQTLVYVGRPTCPQCYEFQSMLETVMKENKTKIYYFDTDKNSSLKQEVIKRYNIISVPSIVVLTKDDFYIIMDKDNQKIIDEISKII